VVLRPGALADPIRESSRRAYVWLMGLGDPGMAVLDELARRGGAARFGPRQPVTEAVKRALAPPPRDGRAGIDARQRDFVQVALAERITALIELQAELL